MFSEETILALGMVSVVVGVLWKIGPPPYLTPPGKPEEMVTMLTFHEARRLEMLASHFDLQHAPTAYETIRAILDRAILVADDDFQKAIESEQDAARGK